MAQFKDHQADEKHETRELLLNRIPELNKRKPRLLTLPSNNFIFESMVLERYPNAIIDCMEIDVKLYNQTKDKLPIKVNYEFGDIFDKTKIFTNMYNCTGQEFRYKVFPKMIVKLGRMFHPKLALKKLVKYKNTSNSVPMSLYLFQTF